MTTKSIGVLKLNCHETIKSNYFLRMYVSYLFLFYFQQKKEKENLKKKLQKERPREKNGPEKHSAGAPSIGRTGLSAPPFTPRVPSFSLAHSRRRLGYRRLHPPPGVLRRRRAHTRFVRPFSSLPAVVNRARKP
jgi:hypothetical protein